MTKKEPNLSLAERLKRLFVSEKPAAASVIIVPQEAKKPAPVQHAADNMAFKAGAAVAFITPIGAYAGNTTQASQRLRAEQQFRHMDSSTNTTIN